MAEVKERLCHADSDPRQNRCAAAEAQAVVPPSDVMVARSLHLPSSAGRRIAPPRCADGSDGESATPAEQIPPAPSLFARRGRPPRHGSGRGPGRATLRLALAVAPVVDLAT
jgi:hypothetical protein